MHVDIVRNARMQYFFATNELRILMSFFTDKTYGKFSVISTEIMQIRRLKRTIFLERGQEHRNDTL